MASNPIPNSQPFTKGDPRINRRGRPKTSEDLKALGMALLHEPARDKDGNPVVIDGHVATNLEMVLRRMMQDKRQAADLLDRVFGKVPSPIDITSKGERITGYAAVTPDDWDKGSDASDTGV